MGKQSLSKLSAYINGYMSYQIVLNTSYKINDLKDNIRMLYNKAGVKDDGYLWIFTDGHIKMERFLIYMNDLLASGEIADLFSVEEKDEIIGNVRGKAKAAGADTSTEGCWGFFMNGVKKNLHVCLCFSPVGSDFRRRATQFPALINNVVIDWFHPWPYDALQDVATKFLEDTELGE